MKKIAAVWVIGALLSCSTLAQSQSQRAREDQPIRISTELVQIDVVVTDKSGQPVKGLTKDDFELYERGKKQLISFFEFVDAGKARRTATSIAPEEQASPQGPTERDVRRVFAFVLDDLTIRLADLTYVREMLTSFVEKQMQPADLVCIVRTVGGRGLLQQFTTDRDLLRRAIATLTATTHPFKTFDQPAGLAGAPSTLESETSSGAGDPLSPESTLGDPVGDTVKAQRAYASLGTASFVIDSMKQLPGRKALVLISGGLPILDAQYSTAAGNVSNFMSQLIDRATRAGVTINTMDIAGLSAQPGVARFEDTPGKSMLDINTSGSNAANPALGRAPDEKMLGRDVMSEHLGLRAISSATGGIAVLNKNDFYAGLEKIINANQAYYLLAYTPQDSKFDGKFRRIEVKVKRDGLKVLNRDGYFAREDKPAATSDTKQDRLLAAIKSPLARRDVDIDTTLLYKAVLPDKAALDIHVLIDPKKLQFESIAEKRQTNFDVAGFVFDEFGKLRGGFSETVTASLTPDEFTRASTAGLTYSANTTLPVGIYQIRLAVFDNKSGNIGTISRYVEVPDLSKGRLVASSLLLGTAPPNDMTATNPTPITANRQVTRKQDLRWAVVIYNAKLKDGQPQLKSQLSISQGGKMLFQEPAEMLSPAAGTSGQLLKVGQIGLSKVRPGRYTMTIVITDLLADKKAQTVTRSMDFVVVN